MGKKIELKHTRVFWSLWDEQKSINLFRGGARSSKTYSIIQAITYWFLSGYWGDPEDETLDEEGNQKSHIPAGTVSIVRQTLPSLKASAYRDFINMLHEVGMYRKVDHRKTTMDFTYGRRMVQFFSSDDLNSEKLRGRQHSIVYINEANTVSWEAFVQLSIRSENFMILDYNPAHNTSEKENWIKTKLEEKRMKEKGDVKLDVSTYFDNIQNLPQRMIDEIEGLKDTDPELYDVYAKGQWVTARNLVFPGFHVVDEWPEEFEKEGWGVDFGYKDPMTCVHARIDGKDLYLRELYYQREKDVLHLAQSLRHHYIPKAVRCDHLPTYILELKSRGIRAVKAIKGKDSIKQGLGFMRSFRIHVHSSSPNLIHELNHYKYKVDKNNEVLPDPIDEYNHAIDAARYALSPFAKSANVVRFV